ncbi:Imidazolonepropionase [Sphingobium sp. YR657]|uniref:amidohydrolase family protein n=1 Tax=Sphingobium sp. YR657 TaxID=1884366 RepID=UPI00092305F6|nr:amidohydrolase family protein [Sphingobium sp. YR657]SHM43945.1 Imidazolonepropionase [Sphingobium sp. YR657]
MIRFALGFAACTFATMASAEPIAITHVRLIDGTGAPPIEDASVLFDGDRLLAAGRDIAIPKNARIVERRGDSVLPMLVSDHVHVGQISGTETGAANYARHNIVGDLAQYRRYGVGTVVALGNNGPLFDTLRPEAHAGKLPADLYGVDQGIGVPLGAPPQAMLKVGPDQLYRPSTAAQAVIDVGRMADAGTDLVKIWLDDFGGSLPVKMEPEIYKAVIAESHRRGLRVAAHIHDLADAKAMVDAGADIIAHGVRDKPVPPALIASMKEKGVWYIATLALDEATVAWAEQQAWTKTPFARADLSAPLAAQVDDPAWRVRALAASTVPGARTSLAMGMANLKSLADAGVKIGFGTDSGAVALRVAGLAEHRELTLSVTAGLTPSRVIRMATQDAASLLNLTDRGVIAPGKRADLLIVSGDPSQDIAAMGHIVESWSHGIAVAGPR